MMHNMSFENPQAEQLKPTFEEMNTALSNEWGKIIAYADLARQIELEEEGGFVTNRLVNEEERQLLYTDLPENTNNEAYGVDENYSFESQAKGIEGVLERLARGGVTPENHEVAAALKKLIVATQNLDTIAWRSDLNPARQEILDRDNFMYAQESLHDAIAKHQPAVTGAY